VRAEHGHILCYGCFHADVTEAQVREPTSRTRLRDGVLVALGAAAQFAAWLVLRPDVDDSALAPWYVLEAVLVVLIGAVAPTRAVAVRAVAAGWALQIAHFAVLVPHGEADNLWGVTLVWMLILAGIGIGLALLTRALTRTVGRR
jgi:hypothetical protein